MVRIVRQVFLIIRLLFERTYKNKRIEKSLKHFSFITHVQKRYFVRQIKYFLFVDV